MQGNLLQIQGKKGNWHQQIPVRAKAVLGMCDFHLLGWHSLPLLWNGFTNKSKRNTRQAKAIAS